MDNAILETENKSFFGKFVDFLRKVGKKIVDKKYLIPSLIIPMFIMLLVFVCLKMFPFGDRTILILDMNGQYIYFFEQLRDVLSFESSLFYTFERALGGEFLGIFTYYLASPLSLIIILFPKAMITEAIMLMMIIKCGLAGFTFACYLDKTRKKNAFGFTMFSTMYALCAYATVFQSNTMWMDAMIWLPLIALGVEKIIKEGKFKLYVISLALTIWSNFYIGYMTCIFVVLYFFCYLFAHKNEDINLLKESHHRLKSLGRIILYSLVAVMIAGFVIISAYYSLSFGKSDMQDNDFSPILRFDFLDLIAKMFVGTYDTVRFEGHPNIYSGLLTLLMIPAYFFSKKVTTREKVLYGILCAIFIVSFSINTIDLVWHGFQLPIWLNYRYSFMFSFIILTMAYKGFENLQETSGKTFFTTGAILALTLFIIQKVVTLNKYVDGNFQNVLPDYQMIWLSLLFIVAYVIVLVILKKTKLKQTVSVILTVIVCIEAFSSSLINWIDQIKDVGWASRDSYTSFVSRMEVAMAHIEEYEEDPFYRTEKTIFRKANDSYTADMYGVSEFTSTFNRSVIKFLKKVGFVSRSQSSKYFSGNEVIDSLLGIKYVIGEGPTESGVIKDSVSGLYEKTYVKDGNLYIYKNPYALSLAYAVDEGIKNTTVENDIISPFEYMEVLVGAMVGLDEGEGYSLFDSCVYSVSQMSNCTTRSTKDALQFVRTNENSPCSFTYKVTAIYEGSIYYFMPTPYSTSATMYVNDVKVETLFSSDTYRIYNLGNYKPGDSIEVRFDFDAFRIYLYNDYPYFVQVNKDNLEDVTNQLKEGNLNITKFDDTLIEGSLSAKEDMTVFTTIPYDKGWKVFVDGVQVQTFMLTETMLGFDVSQGEHSIVMKYQPTEIILGACVSVLGILLFVLLIILDKKKRATATYDTTEGGEATQEPDSQSNKPVSEEAIENNVILENGEISPERGGRLTVTLQPKNEGDDTK